ncbi:unnamed protein product, partial [Discosporangium mesarthrocarpum]
VRLRGGSVGTAKQRYGVEVPTRSVGRARKKRRVERVKRRIPRAKFPDVPRVANRTRNIGSTAEKVRRKAVVVKKDMELTDVEGLLQDVLERVVATEQELKQLKKQGGMTTPTRPTVRSRKFVIDRRATTIGAACIGGLGGMVLGWSVLPNLRLVGAVGGAVAFALISRTPGSAGSFCATSGTQVALLYKDVMDWCDQTVFLYKTGKLSYTYWKVFEEYDLAWGLTEKYEGAKTRLSEEAMELDRQYKIRAKALSAGKQALAIGKGVSSSTIENLTHFSNAV